MTPGTLVRVTAGPHAGREGTVVSCSHDVAEVESWLDRNEILICFAAHLRELAPCPAEHVPATRKSIAAGMRVVVEQLETLRGGCVSVADHDGARRLWRMQQDLVALAARAES